MVRRFLVAVCSVTTLLSPAGAQAQTPGLSAPQPWLSDRSVGEGRGIRTGDFEFHPGVSGELGFDSNFFQRADSAVDAMQFGPPASALRLRIAPYVSLRTLERRLDDKGRATPRTVAFEAGGNLEYNELFGLEGAGPEYADAGNVQGGLGGKFTFFPKHKWSATTGAQYSYRYEPTNQGGLTSDYSRHLVNVSTGLTWQPGKAFSWRLLNYGGNVTLFQQGNLSGFDNQVHQFSSSGKWAFLPKTAALFDATFGLVRYNLASTLNDGNFLHARTGLSGLIGKRFGLLARFGWATSFYANQNGYARNYDGPVLDLEGRVYLTTGDERRPEGFANVGPSTVVFGYSRSYHDGYLSDYFRDDRLYANAGFLLGGVLLTRVSGGLSFIDYPDFQIQGNENPGFGETRLDLSGFAEYRITSTIGLNLTLSYDSNASGVVYGVSYEDDLSFQRFVAMFGVRWFL